MPHITVLENGPYLLNEQTYKLETWYTDGARCPLLLTFAMTSKAKVTRSRC